MILEAASNFCRAFAEFFGWRRQRDALKNAPDVKAAAIANQENAARDAEAKAVANHDIETIRNNLSE